MIIPESELQAGGGQGEDTLAVQGDGDVHGRQVGRRYDHYLQVTVINIDACDL